MKKILIAFDGTHFSTGACEFALKLHQKQPLMLTGVFMPQLSFSSLWSYSGGVSVPELIPYAEDEDGEAIQKNIERFEQFCGENNIPFTVHKDFYNFALPELKKESRFADLLILSSETFYNYISGENAADYVKEALHVSECPVIAVPEIYQFPERILLAYDGSESSVFAIRQFAYLLPELCQLETLVFCLKHDNISDLPEEEYIKELLSQHFTKYSLLKLNLAHKKQLSEWLNNKNAILVSGSLGRNFISQILRNSFISRVIEEHKYPVFIAHK
jgi:hypothetical protein